MQEVRVVVKSLVHRFIAFFVAGFLVPVLSTSIQPGFAQEPVIIQRERPIRTVLPRLNIYNYVSKEVGVNPEEIKALVVSLEDRGFLLKDALTLVYLARARADLWIQEGKVAKEDLAKALHASAGQMAEQVEKETVGWLALIEQAGVKEKIRDFNLKADVAMGIAALKAPGATPSATEEKATRAPLEARRSREGSRQADPVAETTLPREAIFNNLVKEVAVDEKTVEGLVSSLEAQMPLREAVITLFVAKELAEKKIAEGEFPGPQRKAALEASLQQLLPLIQGGAGWGDIGRKIGVPELTGRRVNLKANAILGQK
jgi:hypothetical protein